MSSHALLRSARRRHWYRSRINVGGRLVAPLAEDYHGRPHTYDYYGCRCDLCTAAAARRRRRSAISQPAIPDDDPSHDPVASPAESPVFLPPQPRQSEDNAPPVPSAAPERHPAANLDAELPPITPGAARAITSVEQRSGVIEAYHRPQWSAPVLGSDDVEQRAAHGHLVRVSNATGTILFVGTSDQSSGPPESLRAPRTPRRTRRGGCGTGMPTTFAELVSRLTENGCAVESRGAHLNVTLPDGRRQAVRVNTADWRALRNVVSRFASYGVDLRRQG